MLSTKQIVALTVLYGAAAVAAIDYARTATGERKKRAKITASEKERHSALDFAHGYVTAKCETRQHYTALDIQTDFYFAQTMYHEELKR